MCEWTSGSPHKQGGMATKPSSSCTCQHFMMDVKFIVVNFIIALSAIHKNLISFFFFSISRIHHNNINTGIP